MHTASRIPAVSVTGPGAVYSDMMIPPDKKWAGRRSFLLHSMWESGVGEKAVPGQKLI